MCQSLTRAYFEEDDDRSAEVQEQRSATEHGNFGISFGACRSSQADSVSPACTGSVTPGVSLIGSRLAVVVEGGRLCAHPDVS